MKVSIVYLFFTLCASVAATGIRGSAERIYMQEEIFDDPTKDGGIATGCVGSRTGLRGQQNRCTLRELCEYIWAPTNQYNTKPDPAKMSWPSWTAAMADEIWSAGERTVAEALAIVVQNVDEKDRKGKKKVYYNGYWDASKVLPGFSSTASEYYRAARELGDWQVAARKTIEAQLAGDSLSDEQKRLFKNWNMESERAVKLVLGLRRKDLNEFVIKQMRRPLYFGRLIARTLMTDYEEFVKMDGAKQPDRGGTITMYEQGYPGGRAQLIADYDAAINLMMQTQDNRLHRRAIHLTTMHPSRARFLPAKVLLRVAIYLRPLDQISLLQAFPRIAGLFNLQQFASTDGDGNTILHLQARATTASGHSTQPGTSTPFFPTILDSSEGNILHPQNRDGETPLMEAAFAGNIPFMQQLLEKDPGGLNMVDGNGATALWYAVYGKNAPATALLLEQPGVDVNHELTEDEDLDAYQVTPFMHALWHGQGQYDIISLFIKHPATDLTFQDPGGQTAIHLAIQEKREDIVRDMLECGRLDVNASWGTGWTALHSAAAGYKDTKFVKLLLAQDGIDVNRATNTGRTPLMTTQSPHCMELLLAHPGIEIDRVDDFGWSALSHTAYRGGRGALNCAHVLLQHGARPDQVDLDGCTPRDRAEQAKQWDMVKLLEDAMIRK
ncbi:ankyrin repeat-containing domain protein [Aspergillus germanicus]